MPAGAYPPSTNRTSVAVAGSSVTVDWNATSPASRLSVDSGGGHRVIISGDNFGALSGPAVSCVFALWHRHLAASALTPQCNGLEDFEGEGELQHAAHLVSWTHDTIVLIAPRGAGRRKMVVSVAGQLPTAFASASSRGSLAPDLVYRPPMLLQPYTVDGVRTTEGGDMLTLFGLSLPPPTVSREGSMLGFPMSLVGLNETGLPLQHVVVQFGRLCLTSARDSQGRVPPGIDALGCSSTGPITSTPRRSWYSDERADWNASNAWQVRNRTVAWSVDALALRTPAGIGTNKSVVVRLYDWDQVAGTNVLTALSNPVYFSYAPPSITRIEDSPVVIRDVG